MTEIAPFCRQELQEACDLLLLLAELVAERLERLEADRFVEDKPAPKRRRRRG